MRGNEYKLCSFHQEKMKRTREFCIKYEFGNISHYPSLSYPCKTKEIDRNLIEMYDIYPKKELIIALSQCELSYGEFLFGGKLKCRQDFLDLIKENKICSFKKYKEFYKSLPFVERIGWEENPTVYRSPEDYDVKTDFQKIKEELKLIDKKND